MATTSTNPAETYESYMVPPLFAPAARKLLDAAAPRPGERVLDAACGTGIVARLVAPRVLPDGSVAGIDVSSFMVAVARDRAAREGLAIDWHEGRAEAVPFQDAAFDLVTCQFGVMFFADRAAALAEMHRVIAGDGRVAIHVFQGIDRHPFYQRLDEVIAARFAMSGVGDIFSLGDAGALESSLVDAGFSRVTVEEAEIVARFPNPNAFLAGEIDVDTAAIPQMQDLDAEGRARMAADLAADMRDALCDATQGEHVVIPFHTLIALASR
jgi:ubiquinone/menaquinone biosynthesis C-methylase UbiE